MEDKENSSTNDQLKDVLKKLEIAEKNNEQLRIELNKKNKHIEKLVEHGKRVDRLVQGLRNYIDGLIPAVKMPADLAMPTSSSLTCAVAVTTTSASVSPLQLISNANVQLVVDQDKSKGEPSDMQQAVIREPDCSEIEPTAIKVKNVEQEKENSGEHCTEPSTMIPSSNNDAVTRMTRSKKRAMDFSNDERPSSTPRRTARCNKPGDRAAKAARRIYKRRDTMAF